MFKQKFTSLIVSLVVSVLSMSVMANDVSSTSNDNLSKESVLLLNTLKQDIISTMIAVSEMKQQAKNDDVLDTYEVNIPMQIVSGLGLEIDFSEDLTGFDVLSIDEESPLIPLGISKGDIIREINGIAVNKESLTTRPEIKYLWKFHPGQQVNLLYSSSGENKTISFTVPSLRTPQATISIDFE